MSVSYKKLLHLLIERGIQPSEIAEMSGFSANIMTRIKRNQYISLESVEKLCYALNCTVDEIIEFRKEIEDSDEEIQ
jgi:putative transcriptional regulator